MRTYFAHIKVLSVTMLVTAIVSCGAGSGGRTVAYRTEMRNFVIAISEYARSADSDFIVIPQNGQELISSTGDTSGAPATGYVAAINGQGREDMFYGYTGDDTATPAVDSNYLSAWCDYAENQGISVLATDYCTTQARVDDSYAKNDAHGFISTATVRNLDQIPSYPAIPHNENTNDIANLSQARNFLYLINPDYMSKAAFLSAAQGTDYDLVIIDLFFDGTALTSADVNILKTKNNGHQRLVICYMSIAEAEDYRWYWQSSWSTNPPAWLYKPNPDWPGNYKVYYWDKNWQSIIYGNASSYTRKILDAGFDGVYLDIIDAFEYYEEGN